MTNVEIKIDEKFTKEFDFNYFENFCLDEILSQVKKKISRMGSTICE